MDDFFQFEAVPNYLQNLNPQQKEAVQHVDGPILVLAGAGSGKTRVLTNRIAHLVLGHHVNPVNILAVTFTNKAAGEMKKRLQQLLGERAERLWASTFHSAALRILRRYATLIGYPDNNFAIYDDNDSKQLVKRIMKELNVDEKKFPASSFLNTIDRAKNDYVSPQQFRSSAVGSAMLLSANIYERYQEELFKAGAMDFGDLLVNVVKLFQTHPDLLESFHRFIHYILIDEFQDTNKVQYLFIKQISEPRRNIFVVGDDDQSIYSFRGADISNILNFEKDFPGAKVVTLEQNYRSTQNILEAAYSVISKNKARKAKKLWTSENEGNKIITYTGESEDDEALYVVSEISKLKRQNKNYSDCAIFYRTNAQSRALEEALLKFHIPYRIYGGLKFYERKEIKDILAYLKLITNERDSQSFLRALNTPPRGIGDVTVTKISQKAAQDGTSLWQAASDLRLSNPKIKGFVELIEEFKRHAKQLNLGSLIDEIIHKTGYLDKIKASKEIGNDSKIENIYELIALGQATAQSGETPESALQTFLDKVSLTSGDEMATNEKTQSSNSEKVDAVSLMTLHLAKGLEFPIVFFTGLEEGLLPHYRSLQSEREIAEERRLCYVGITRARQILYLTHATVRGMFSSGGSFDSANSCYRIISRFLNDIPKEYLDDHSPATTTPTRREPEKSTSKHWEADDYSSVYHEYGGWQKKSKTKVIKNPKILNSIYKEPPQMPEKSNLPPSLMSKKLANSLSVADAHLYDIPENALLLKDHIEKAVTGLKVLHANFGQGTILDIDIPASKDPNKTKIKIIFDNQAKEKTLLLGKARLAIVE